MMEMAIHRPRSMFAKVLRPASLILVSSLFVVAAAQNVESPPPRQSWSDRRMGLSGPLRDTPQRHLRIPHAMPVSPNFQKSRSSSVGLAAEGTATQLFLDPSAPQYPAGQYPLSVSVGDFNRDGKDDLAVTNGVGGYDSSSSVSVLLNNGDGSFQTHVVYTNVGCLLRSTALGDFNGDGKTDLAVAFSCKSIFNFIGIFLANDDGTFQYGGGLGTGLPYTSVVVGDFNGDGKTDLAATNDQITVALGKGDGTFQTYYYAAGNTPLSVAVGDFNGDAKADLAVANRDDDTVSVFLGTGDGTFHERVDSITGDDPDSVAVGDFNGDGRADLAVTNGSGNSVSVLLSNGDGTFQTHVDYAAGNSPSSVAVGDFNGDRRADLAVTNGSDNSVSVLLGNGDGTFQTHVDYGTGNSPTSGAVGDFNGDGKADLAVTNGSDNSVSVLLGNGDGTFQSPRYETGARPESIAVGDFNGDRRSDLAVANGSDSTVGVLLGKGDGTFQTHVDYPAGVSPYSVAVGDFNGDSKADLAVSNYTGHTVSVLLGSGDGTFQAHGEYPTGGSMPILW